MYRQFAEDYDSEESLHQQYFDSYADLGVHRVMLEDAPRMSFFHEAMTRSTVVQDRVVVDVGSGTGVLSMWAARSGAKHVFSIEASPISHTQALVISDNQLSESITILSETVERIILDGPESFVARHKHILQGCGVSLLVSEWMGFYLLHEGMLPSVIRARDFFAEVNGLLGLSHRIEMVPQSATIRVAPMSCLPYYEQYFKRFWSRIDGLDFRRYGEMECEAHLTRSSPLVENIPPSCLLHEGVPLVNLELNSVREDTVTSLCSTLHFNFCDSAAFQRHIDGLEPGHSIVVDGFTLWFEVSFRDLVLSTSPCLPLTHWKQTTILFPKEAREEKLVAFENDSTALDVKVSLSATDASLRCYTIEFELM